MCRANIISNGLWEGGQFKGFLSYGHSLIITTVTMVPDCVPCEIQAESEEKVEHQEQLPQLTVEFLGWYARREKKTLTIWNGCCSYKMCFL